MHRTRVVAAALAVTLPFSTIQAVDAPLASAQTTQVRTVTELDRDAFNSALAVWQEERDKAQNALDAANAEKDAKQTTVDNAKRDLAEAIQTVAEANESLNAARVALEEVNVEARERDAEAAAEQLARAEEVLATAQRRVEDAEQRAAEAAADRENADELVATAEQRRAELEGKIERIEETIGTERSLQSELEERDRIGADYSVDDWERLTSQAIAEYINEYRVTNGLHPLVTHTIYNDQARAWSEQMVSDLPAPANPNEILPWTSYPDAFRHSSSDEWGHSGENILISHIPGKPPRELIPSKPEEADRSQWNQLPEMLFDQWRNSPGHNRGMLNPAAQGMGLGVQTRENGEIWATTMFFIHDTTFNDGLRYFRTDQMTKNALASGEGFYVPAGAREAMWVAPIKDPLTDTKGYTPDASELNPIGLDKTIGKPAGFDHAVTIADNTPEIGASREREQMLIDELTLLNRDLTNTTRNLETLTDQARTAAENQRVANERLETLRVMLRDARNAHTSGQNAKDRADDALAFARSVDKQPLLQAVSDAETALSGAETSRADAEETLEGAQAELAQAERAVRQAENQRERVPARPVEAAFMVAREITEIIPDTKPAPGGSGQEGGSSTGAIVGAVLGVLAVIGIAAAAWPQIAKALNL